MVRKECECAYMCFFVKSTKSAFVPLCVCSEVSISDSVCVDLLYFVHCG